MKQFSELLDRLSYTPGRNEKVRLLLQYLRAAPDPDRGWAVATLTDSLPFSFPFRRTLAELVSTRVDPDLYRLSRDYVGDTAETVALIWPEPGPDLPRDVEPPPRLSEIVAELAIVPRHMLSQRLATWLDHLDATGRWALLKLLTGAMRVGVSARLVKVALAEMGGISPDEIEQVWHGLAPPYAELFAWLEGRSPRPDTSGVPVFRPLMLAHPLEENELAVLDLDEFAVEWKWDGIRVQIAATGAEARLYSRSGDDIGRSFPDIVEAVRFDAVLDGELVVLREGIVAEFNELQQRLNRREVSRKLLDRFPAHVRLYDALEIEGIDLRNESFSVRRARLENWHARTRPLRMDLSELIEVSGKAALMQLWSTTRPQSIEGLMLKRRASRYLAGRPKGEWYKWKRAPLTLDCVLMYAQRGSGKRSSYYSDYTFGVWREVTGGNPELVPIGKAYSGFTDEELLALDRWVRANTKESYGPVRAVNPGLVLEVAFDSVQPSSRHKSGVAMRFPRIHRIRWDKPAPEADRLETVLAMIGRVLARQLPGAA